MCRVPNTSFNLSHESLDSEEARQALNTLVRDDPAFYAEITRGESEQSVVTDTEEVVAEDMEGAWDLEEGDDDVSLSMKAVIAKTGQSDVQNPDVSPDAPSDLDEDDSDSEYVPPTYVARNVAAVSIVQEEGSSSVRGKRVPVPTKRYMDASRWTCFEDPDAAKV